MFCILTRTTGRTSPNTRRPSRDSNNSLGCHCMKKERSDENVSHRVLAGASWKRSPRCCPFWIVAALSHCEVDAERRDQGIEFHRAGFHGQLDGPTPCIDRSAAGSGAASLLGAAAERLRQWGVPQKEIARLESTGKVQQELEVDSPVSGYITERNALPSVAVQPEMRLYTIADLSTVWVQAQVFQNDLERIKIGAPATLTVNTYPGRTFTGRVDFIYPQVDMDTRTAKVRVVFSNPGLQLKPGMFVNVSLKVPMGNQLVIPASGVLQSGTRAIAFVERSDGYIEPREVQLGSRVGDDLIVLKGLKAGEQIVTSANFLIDSESQLQAALGSFVPPPPGAGAASTTNAPQGIVELSSDPTTPRKGSNEFRVKLTDASGAPISGAEVSVTFFMPAMPAMGMASMRTPVTLSDKGNGLYEGSGQLDSGGTWQVTILAKKNGQLIASKQLSVNATGGM